MKGDIANYLPKIPFIRPSSEPPSFSPASPDSSFRPGRIFNNSSATFFLNFSTAFFPIVLVSTLYDGFDSVPVTLSGMLLQPFSSDRKPDMAD